MGCRDTRPGDPCKQRGFEAMQAAQWLEITQTPGPQALCQRGALTETHPKRGFFHTCSAESSPWEKHLLPEAGGSLRGMGQCSESTEQSKASPSWLPNCPKLPQTAVTACKPLPFQERAAQHPSQPGMCEPASPQNKRFL